MTPLAICGFLAVTSLVLLVSVVVSGRKNRLQLRLDELAGKGVEESVPETSTGVAQLARTALPALGTPLMPRSEEDRTRLQARLMYAGYYNRQAMVIFSGVKMLLILTAFAGLAAAFAGLVPLTEVWLLANGCLVVLGIAGPSFFLDRRKTARQNEFRHSLPDALDVLVICLEGGLSLPAAFRRLSQELRTTHPLLASEVEIIQREMQLGLTAGEALGQFADRSDLEEIRGLAAVITQAERLGASLSKALRVHADSLRTKRMQAGEEMAQKAAIKILFPTFLCIFPGIFIVVLGPAIFQILEMFTKSGM